ncbi:MAG TPA: PqqD family protein [Nitriliruptorales bacterium]|nr:PqqD family protein [Nitriliruptorales bacterium]
MNDSQGVPAELLGLDDAPQRRLDLAAVELDGETVVYDQPTGGLHTLNRTATLVWSFLDGGTTLRALVGELAEVFATDPSILAGDVVQLVRDLGRQGLLEGVVAEPVRADGAVGPSPTSASPDSM